MNIHIDKKIAITIIISLIVGGVIGGGIGFAAGHEEGHGKYEMKGQAFGGQYDNHADGEMADDQGGAPNQEQQNMVPAGNMQPSQASTTATTTVKTK